MLTIRNVSSRRSGQSSCSSGTVVWTGTSVGLCATFDLWDAERGDDYAPTTNSETHYIFDACGNQVGSGSSYGWHDLSGLNHSEAGSSSTSIRAVPYECYGIWTGVYTFTQTFTDGETLSDTGATTFRVYRSESEARAAQYAQASLTGGPIGPGEQMAGCGETHSTRAQATSYPIDTATGNFWHTFTDLSIPGRGPAIEVQRTYNSLLAQADGPFGHGWSDWYGQRLEIDTSTVVLHGCSGSKTSFTLEDGSWKAPPRVLGALEHNADDTWTYRRAGRDRYDFDSTGRLTAIADRKGETTQVAYPNADTRVVTDPAGRYVTFNLTGGRVTSLQDSSAPARTVTYDYDDSGNLTDVIDIGGGHWTFAYDNQHRMVTMRSPKFFDVSATPDPVVTNHYDSEGRVDWQSDQLGRKTTLDYTTIPNATIVTNPAGNAVEYDYNADGLLVGEVRGYGSTTPSYWVYRYDPDTLGRTVVIDGNARTWQATYDPDGNRVTQTDPLGRTTSYSYNSFHEVTSVTGPRKINGQSIVTELTYDAYGNLKTHSRPLLDQDTGALLDTAVTNYEYSDPEHPGDLTAIVDPNGHRTSHTYDSHGNLTSTTSPPTAEFAAGNKTTYEYDTETGWLTSVTPPRGNLPGAEPTQFATTFSHNQYGQVTRTRSPLWDSQSPSANQTIYDYDADGNLKSVTDGEGNTTTYTVDAAGQVTKVHRADGSEVLTSYEPDGNVDVIVDAAQNETKFDYDAFGRLQKRTDPLSRATTYMRDRLGNITGITDAQNRQITYTRNVVSQVTGVTFSTGGPTNITNIMYDEEGRRTAATDASGTSTWVHDSLGRLIKTTDGSGSTTAFHYDLAGRQERVDYPNALGSVVRTFDASDRVTELTDLAGREFGFDYDADSNPAAVTYPNGTQTTYAVNPGGQITAIRHASQSSPAQPFAGFDYTYDGASKVKTVVSTGVPEDNHTYDYDQLNRLTGIDATTLTYDDAGNLTKRPDGLMQVFDRASQLTKVSGPSITYVGGSSASSPTSSSLTLAMPSGVQDRDQAVVAVTFPAGKSITGFPGFTLISNPTSGGTKGSEVALYRKTLAAGESSATVSFKGKFDKSAVLAVYRNVDPTTPVRSQQYGNNGGVAGSSLTIGSLNAVKGDRLLWVAGAYGTPGTWTPPSAMTPRQSKASSSTDVALADEALEADGATGSRTASHSTSAAIAGVLVALRPVSIGYTWTATGRRATTTDSLSSPPSTSSHSFDAAGQLAGWTSGSSSVTYKYNADGLRSSKTSGTTTTNFAWDQTTPNPSLLSDGVAAYVYGPFGQPLERVDGGDNDNVSYYAQDLLGSTRALTDGAGSVQGTYTYDAYGSMTAKTGTVTNPLTYTGQYQDSETGYVYLRARYYDPSTAGFLSRDPLEDSTGSPYSYAYSNPTNLTDPSGLCPPCAILAGAVAGGAVDLGFQVLDNLLSGCDPLADISWGRVGMSAGIGGLTGGIGSWVRSAGGATDGVALMLRYKSGWSADQVAAANAKVAALNGAARAGQLRVTAVQRSGTSAASRYKSAGGTVPKGSDVDHTIDLQLGGIDDLANMSPLEMSVNRSLGSQIMWQLKGVEQGTCVISVSIC